MRLVRPFTLVGVLLLMAVAGCDRPAERPAQPPGGSVFTHDISADQSGYYRPLTPVRTGDWTLIHLFIGQDTAFTAWEDGERITGLAPVTLEFEDATGTRTRVVPSRYSVTDSTISLAGRSEELGEVTFDGRLDADALATARRNLGDQGAVVTGSLKAGGRSFSGVRFRWWAGD